MLKEQEFSLSDMADHQSQIQIGKLLSAQYIVLGDIIDLVEALLISVRLVDVTSGEIILTEEITGKIENYDFIGAYFAKSVLTQFGAEIFESTEQKISLKAEIIMPLSI